jgi:hypothetical protein
MLEKHPLPEQPPPGGARRLWKRVLEEGRSLVPTWLFFFSLFFLLRLMRMEVLRDQKVQTLPRSLVFIGSLIVAKGILLVDLVPFVKRVRRFPVFWAASLKTLAYFVVVFVFQYLDGLWDLRHEGVRAATREFGRSLLGLSFWVNQVWLVVLLFVYSATRELFHRLGAEKFREVFFGRSSAS